MTDKQLLVFYAVFLTIILTAAALAHNLLRSPTGAQEYADKLCAELYGPQTGAVWLEGKLKCETARGEVIEVRKL